MRQILVNGLLPNNGCVDENDRFTDAYIDCDGDGLYFLQVIAGDDLFHVGSYAMDVACYATIGAASLSDWQCKLSEGSYLLNWGDDTGQLPMPDYVTGNLVGYVTIDASITCSGGMQDYNPVHYFAPNYVDTDAAVLGPDHGVMENSNILMGDIFYYDNKNSQADGVPAIHIEAFGEDNLAVTNGIHTWGMLAASFTGMGINTFYYKYEDFAALPPYDAREQLPLWWGFRYIGNAAFDGGTWVDVWRSHNFWFDHWLVTVGGTGPCNFYGSMSYSFLGDLLVLNLYGLRRPGFIAFDEEETTTGGTGGPSPPPITAGFNLLFLESQRVRVIEPEWPLVAESGWIGLSFVTDTIDFGPGFGNSFDQSWVNVRYTANNKYSVGLSAISYLNGCALLWNGAGFTPTATH
jgi:hypothetical protein